MNEMCENFFGEDINILTKEGKEFTIEVGNFIRNKLIKYQEETGNLYNFEATPAESTCFRLAKKDKEEFDDIITRGTKEAPYYTNSCHIPVNKIESIHQVFEHQDELQTLFTGGTVIHLFMNGAISGSQAKEIIKTVCTKYKTPYISISPLNRYCPDHGYVEEKVDNCPKCNKPVEKYQRITGYLRKVEYFNEGKKSEFRDRKQL
jgi:ribonucleoside-triphosphate reductase